MNFEERVEKNIAGLVQDQRFRVLDQSNYHKNRYPLCFDSNDYLDLSHDSFFQDQIKNISSKVVLSSCSSRLLGGESPVYEGLEKKFAQWKNAPAAVLFASGYQANVSLLQALGRLGERGQLEFFSDELNHASLIDGIALSKSKKYVYKHLDCEDLERALQASQSHLKVIVTESVFGMDGDCFDFDRVYHLAQKYECLLVVDEAHALGVLGDTGRGLVNHFEASNLVTVNPCGKAMGTTGAVVVGPRWLKDWLIQSSRGLIYSTGLSPWIVAALSQSVDYVQSLSARREHLSEKALFFSSELRSQGKRVLGQGGVPIVSWVIGDTDKTVKASKDLLQKNIQVLPIRYPTVAKGSDRLRFTLHAGLNYEQLKYVLIELKDVRQ